MAKRNDPCKERLASNLNGRYWGCILSIKPQILKIGLHCCAFSQKISVATVFIHIKVPPTRSQITKHHGGYCKLKWPWGYAEGTLQLLQQELNCARQLLQSTLSIPTTSTCNSHSSTVLHVTFITDGGTHIGRWYGYVPPSRPTPFQATVYPWRPTFSSLFPAPETPFPFLEKNLAFWEQIWLNLTKF